jgi:hypothetical protein
MTLADFIRNSTQNLQRMSEAMPSSGVSGAAYLNFNGKTGVWQLSKEAAEPKSLGHLLVPQYGIYERMIEWAGARPLQKTPPRQLLGVHYDEPLSERMFKNPLSPHLYKKDNDGPTHTYGFLGVMLDDNANVVFEHSSNGAKKAFNVLATSATQALAAFGEIVHPVIGLDTGSWTGANGTIYEPKFVNIGYVTDKRVQEADAITNSDIITRPTPSRAKLRREASEGPALGKGGLK